MKSYLLFIFILPFALASCSFQDKVDGDALASKGHPGRRYYLRECGRCHQHYQPSDYSAVQWGSILARKQSKVSLTDSQFEKLTDFILTQAKPPLRYP